MRYVLPIVSLFVSGAALASPSLSGSYSCGDSQGGAPTVAVTLDAANLLMTITRDDVTIRTHVSEYKRTSVDSVRYIAPSVFEMTFEDGKATFMSDTLLDCKRR